VRIERIFRSKFVVVWRQAEALLEKLKCVEAKNPIFRPTAAEGAKIFEIRAPARSKSAAQASDGAKIFGSVKRRNAGFMAQKCDPMRDRAP
jgi:hypothetical protein